MNILDILQQVPPKVRIAIYAVVALGALAFSVWQASDGNWWLFVGNLFISLQGLMSAKNVDTSPAAPEIEAEEGLF